MKNTDQTFGPTSEALFERAKKVSPGGVHSPVRAFKSVGGTPIFFKSASGATLTTVEGHTLIDFCMGFGPHILGHRDADVSEVVHQAVETAWAFGACDPYSLDLAEWVIQKLPHLEMLRFVSSGTEAVMSALRVARGATGRSHIVKFEGCYHGHVDSLLVKAGSGLAGRSASDSLGVPPEFVSTTHVLPLDNEDALEKFFAENGERIAAVIVEPLPANYGLLEQRTEFLKKIFSVAHKHKALVIFDEVISGFRLSLGGMAERLGVTPDLVTFGKVLGGGLALGAYGGRKDLMSMVAPQGAVYQAGTLSANPIAVQAGLATLKKMERVNGYDVLNQRTTQFCEDIGAFLKAQSLPMVLDHVGSIFWFRGITDRPIRCLDQIPSTHAETFKKFFHECLKHKIYLAPSGYEVGFLSLAHSPQVLDQALEGLKKALRATFAKQ